MATPRVTIDELPESISPSDGDVLVVQDSGITKKMTVATLKTLAADVVVDHIADPTGAHAATAISAAASGTGVDGANVQAQLVQLAGLVGTGGGGGIDPEDAVDAVAAALVEGTGIDIVYNDAANQITIAADKTEMSLSATDVGLGNVTNVAQAPASRTISTTAPLSGGGDLSANRTLAVSTFTAAAPGVVPLSGGGTANFLRADGTWAAPPGGGGGITGITVAEAGTALDTDITTIDFQAGFDLTESPENEVNVSLDLSEYTGSALPQAAVANLTADLAARQPLDADLTTIAGLTATTDNVIQSVGSAWASRTPTELKSSLSLTKSDVGLSNVDNTSDASKPVSTAQASANALKADKATTISTTAPLAGGGDLSANRTLTVDAATATAVGVVELATTAEATAATDTVRAVTPAGLADRVLTSRTISTTAPLAGGGALTGNLTLTVSAASDTATGVVELATAAETATGTDTTRAVTPAGAAGTYTPLAQTINAQTGTTYTLVLADLGRLVTLSNAAAVTLTVPTNASVAFPVGSRIDLVQKGAGQVTVAGTPTVNATPTKKSRAQYSGMTLVKEATDTWYLFGDLAAT